MVFARGEAFCEPERPAFREKYYVPREVAKAWHQQYLLTSSFGCRYWATIHARRHDHNFSQN